MSEVRNSNKAIFSTVKTLLKPWFIHITHTKALITYDGLVETACTRKLNFLSLAGKLLASFAFEPDFLKLNTRDRYFFRTQVQLAYLLENLTRQLHEQRKNDAVDFVYDLCTICFNEFSLETLMYPPSNCARTFRDSGILWTKTEKEGAATIPDSQEPSQRFFANASAL